VHAGFFTSSNTVQAAITDVGSDNCLIRQAVVGVFLFRGKGKFWSLPVLVGAWETVDLPPATCSTSLLVGTDQQGVDFLERLKIQSFR
jgi:hypothetical protein